MDEFSDKLARLQAESPEAFADIEWHFIGHLQSNKVRKLIQTSLSLRGFVVETVDSQKLASKLDKEAAKAGRQEPIGVLVQVLTSDEGTKHGCLQEEVAPLV